jgi:hypothetical protein
MADAFTLVTKTQAIQRYVERRGLKSKTAITTRLAEVERYVRLGLPLSEIRALIIDMRAWCWEGPAPEARWFDDRLDELADYLASPEERLELRELAARLEESILASHGR